MLVDVEDSFSVYREEIFGPVVVATRFSAENGVQAAANDTPYGLAASVWTKDIEKGELFASRIEAGNACVNDCVVNYAAQELPFGGVGESGIGVRHSAKGIQKYCRTQSVLVTRMGQKREVHMFPYTPRMTRLIGRFQKLLYGRGKRD